MDGNEEVRLVLVGYLCPAVQLHEPVGLAGIDHLHVRAVLLHQLSEGQCHSQRECLLADLTAHSTCISSTMAGIDDECKLLVGSIS